MDAAEIVITDKTQGYRVDWKTMQSETDVS